MSSYLLEKQSCTTPFRSDLKQLKLRGFFEDGHPKNNKNKMSSDMRSVPDLNILWGAWKKLWWTKTT